MILAIARVLARGNQVRLGCAPSKLARHGQHAATADVESESLPGFAVARNAKLIMHDDVYNGAGGMAVKALLDVNTLIAVA